MAVLSTSYNVESGVKTTLKETISPTTTTGIKLNYALTITSGVLLFDEGTDREEFISFGGASVSSGVTTLSDVTRDLSLTANTFSGSGTGSQHSGGACTVKLTNYHALYNLKANTDRANTFSAAQTISGTNKLYLNDSDSYIYDNGTDLVFKSTAQAERTLSQLASLSGSNDKIKITSSDTTEGYANSKLNFNDGLVATVTSPAGNEGLQIDLDLATDSGLEISAGKVQVKVKSSGGIVRDSNGLSFDQTGNYTLTGTWDFSSASLSGGFTESLTLGENVTAGQSIAIHGDGMVWKAQSDVLNDCFTLIGVAQESGSAAASKKISTLGSSIPISGMTATNGRLWTGQSNTTSNTSVAVYDVNRSSQSFTPTTGQTRVDQIDLSLTKVGSPTGSYSCAIYATDGSGLPTGAALATATLATSAMATGLNRFTGFGLTVTPGTKYAIGLFNASADAGNHYTWAYQNTDVYATGNRGSSTDGGSSWAASSTHDMYFTVYYNAVAGSDIYLTDTVGTMSLVPGTYFQRVGRAISASKMIGMVGSPSLYATYTWSSSASDVTVDTEISIGFRPRSVIAIASIGSWYSVGFWSHGIAVGTSYGFGISGGSSGSNTVANDGYLAYGASAAGAVSDYTRLFVQSVGADTITIRREMNDDIANAPGGTVRLLIFG